MFRRRHERHDEGRSVVPPELEGADRAYFLEYGYYPPTISPGTTPEELQARIDGMSILADGTHDHEAGARLVHEIGYLADRAVELRRIPRQ